MNIKVDIIDCSPMKDNLTADQEKEIKRTINELIQKGDKQGKLILYNLYQVSVYWQIQQYSNI